MSEVRTNGPERGALVARLIVGMAQGSALYLLARDYGETLPFGLSAAAWERWRATLSLVATFAPLPVLFGIGNLPLRKLVPWALAAAGALFAFGWYGATSAWRGAPPQTWLFALITLYIVHEFVQAADDEGKPIASYAAYFDRAWRQGFQAALAIGFTLAFWVVILLGAWLFRLIGFEAVYSLITSEPFRWVASSAAFAVGVHLTDAEAGLTRGARQIGLALLSWLAILMTLILAAFLAALPFTGLEPLWDTKRATVLLLNAAATMILLINAAYQAGDPPKSSFMRAVVRFSALPLAGVVALAALGLSMRVNQYGFTPARVLAGAELMIVAVYAIGYLAAALKPGPWLALVRPVNIGAALFVAITLAALMTPVADPARIAVADQVARLDRGAVEPDDFDFGFLADPRSGAWGKHALETLAARSGDEREERIALLAKNPVSQDLYQPIDQSFNDRRAALTLIGDGTIPDAALLVGGGNDPVSACVASMKAFAEEQRLAAERARQRERLGRRLTTPVIETDPEEPAQEPDPEEGRCLARLLDLDFDGDEDLLLLVNDRWANKKTLLLRALLNDGGRWTYSADLAGPRIGAAAAAGPALEAARERRALFRGAAPAVHPYKDVLVAGRRIRLDGPADVLIEARALIDASEGLEPPAAIFAEPLPFNIRGTCADDDFRDDRATLEAACVPRRMDIDGDGADEYVLVGVHSYGSIRIEAFDAANGAFRAAGAQWADVGWSSWADRDDAGTAEGEAWRRAERRRIVAEATLSPPLLGDLLIGGARCSFSYVDPAAAP